MSRWGNCSAALNVYGSADIGIGSNFRPADLAKINFITRDIDFARVAHVVSGLLSGSPDAVFMVSGLGRNNIGVSIALFCIDPADFNIAGWDLVADEACAEVPVSTAGLGAALSDVVNYSGMNPLGKLAGNGREDYLPPENNSPYLNVESTAIPEPWGWAPFWASWAFGLAHPGGRFGFAPAGRGSLPHGKVSLNIWGALTKA